MHELFCSEIVKRAPTLLESAQWADCKFVVGAEPHQVVVGGYKLIMALASPVFEAMFYGSLAETRDEIPIGDVEPVIFQAMLQYMYTDKINIISWTEACELYYAAKKYMLDQLMVLCSEYLQTNLNAGNVCQIYEHSLLYGDDALTQKCNKMFSDNTGELLKDNSFTAADINTVTAIFSLDSLNLDSELDLIEAAARYAEVHNIKIREETSASPSTSTSTDEVSIDEQVTTVSTSKKAHPRKMKCNAKTKRRSGLIRKKVSHCRTINNTEGKQLFRSAVGKIRFLTLTSEQFANCSARRSVLTWPEEYAVLMNISSPKSDVAMPSDLSTSRKNRIYKTSFYFKLNGCSYGNTVTSQVHYFRKLKWQIKFSKYSQNWNDRSRFSLLCTNESQSSIWSCDVSAELRIISQTPGVKPFICNLNHVFSQSNSEAITQHFSSDVFIKKNYLKNDSMYIEVFIKMNKAVGI